MSFIHNSALAGAGGQAAGGYEIEQSLRFDGASYLSRTPSAAGTLGTWTISYWAKRSKSGLNMLFNSGSVNQQGVVYMTDGGDNMTVLGFNSTAQAKGWSSYGGVGKLRDFSAWYHVLIRAFSSSSANSYDGVELEIYINGEETGTSIAGGSPTGGCRINDGQAKTIGYSPPDGYYFNGYVAEWHLVDGTAAAVTDFGEFDNNGVWRPIEYTGSHGTQGYYLKFDPTATNGIGHDHSGNGNNFSPTGFSTSGTGTDVMSDTPTNNHCTFNPLDLQGSTLTNGSLNASMPGRAAGTMAVTSGKWYWECKYNAGNGYVLALGVADIDAYYPSEGFSFGVIYYGGNGNKYVLGTSSSYSSAYSGGHFGIALDLDSAQNTIEFFLNGTSKGTIDIPDGRNWTPIVQGGSASTSGSWDMYIDENTWTYTAPTGFNALNTANLPAPDIKDGSKNFNTVTYSGDATGRTITGVGFQADFLWNKLRDTGAQDHLLYDTVRGIGSNGNYVRLRSNTATAEEDPATANQDLTAFTSDGFTIGTHAALNGNNQAYVTWLWKAGNGNSSIAAGSIDGTNPTIASTVSTNASAGFSIVGYTGDGQNNATVGHGLGVTPRLCIGKSRAANSWYIRHESLGSNLNLNFNDQGTVAPGGGGLIGDLTSPTTISLPGGSNPGSGNMNANGTNYIMYCFAEVEGYSKVGSYIGNASTDGPFVYCGFRPAYIWLKGLFASNWNTYDSARSEFNAADDLLRLNSPAIEVPNYSLAAIDLLSNGFKIRTSSGDWNSSGQTFVFCAFAENPFGGSGVSPATAR